MRYFIYVIITVVMLAPYLSDPAVAIAPGPLKFLVELVSVIVAVYVIVVGSARQFRNVNAKYWLIFGALAFVVVCGPLVNQEAVGPIVSGARYYFRSIPIFFLPAVFDFSERDVGRYLKFILAFSLLQVPVELYQRVKAVSYGYYTGDFVSGTMLQSGYVSLFLIAVMCVMCVYMLRKRMSKLWFAACFLLLVVAVSINETKVTLVVLPIALFVTFVYAAPSGRRLGASMQAFGVLAVFAAIFIPVYDSLNKKDDGTPGPGILEFFTDPDQLSTYMNTKPGVGTGKDAGRGDSIEAPFLAFGKDPIKLTFGLGLGNVTRSSLGDQFTGRYMRLYYTFALELSVSTFLFEIGVLGTALVLLLHWVLLRDALFVAKHEASSLGTLAVGYVGVWVTITIGLFYSTIHISEPISYIFWFISGLIATRRQQLALARVSASRFVPGQLIRISPKAGTAA